MRVLRPSLPGVTFRAVSLAEIEAAADALSVEQQKALLAHLAQRLERVAGGQAMATTYSGNRSRRGFPISRGRTAFGDDEVARIEAEAEARG